MIGFKRNIKLIAGLIVSCLVLCVSIGLIIKKAPPESQAASSYKGAGSCRELGWDTLGCYYLEDWDGNDWPAYCTESNALGPEFVEYYERSRSNVDSDLMRGLDYILYYGYDYSQPSDVHYGSGLSGNRFMEATQAAVWKFIGTNARSAQLSGTGYHDDHWEEVWGWYSDSVTSLANSMVTEAIANQNTAGPWDGFASLWVYNGGNGGSQGLMLGRGSRHSKLSVTKMLQRTGSTDVDGMTYTFQLWKDDVLIHEDTLPSDSDVLVWDDLDEGTYVVKEIAWSWPTVRLETEKTVTLGKSDDQSVQFVNDEKSGTLEFIKVNKKHTEQAIAGAHFELKAAHCIRDGNNNILYNEGDKVYAHATSTAGVYEIDRTNSANNDVYDFVSGENGLIRISGIFLDRVDTRYILTETQVPPKFKDLTNPNFNITFYKAGDNQTDLTTAVPGAFVDESHPYLIANTSPQKIGNEPKYGKISITKVVDNYPITNDPNNNPNATFTFRVHFTGTNVDGTTVDDWHTVTLKHGDDAWVSPEYEEDTSYTIEETGIPTGYSFVSWVSSGTVTTGATKTGSIVADETTGHVCHNKRDRGRIKVIKSSTDNPVVTTNKNNSNYTFKDIVYKLYLTYADAQNNVNALDTLTLAASGESNISNYHWTGTYYLKETSNANTGYLTDPTIHTVVIKDENLTNDPDVVNGVTQKSLQDNPMYGYITVTKTSASLDGHNTVTGTEFTYELVGTSTGVTDVTSTKSTTTGTVKFGPLPLGDYKITETQAGKPFYRDRQSGFTVKLRQKANTTNGQLTASINNGTATDCVNDTTLFPGNPYNNVCKVTDPSVTSNRQWAYLEVEKKNDAHKGTVTTKVFRFELYKRGSTNLLGIAVTGDADKSHITGTQGKAVFMKPNGTNPGTEPVDLPVVNDRDSTEGHYEVYETSTTAPFWQNGAHYYVDIYADGVTGLTKANITLAGSPNAGGTVMNASGEPVTSITNQAGTTDSRAPQALRTHNNTNVIYIGDDQYAFIRITKHNMETGGDIKQAGFEFELYGSLANAVNKTNAIEHKATDGNGVAAFATQLPVQGTFRAKPTSPTSGCAQSGMTRNDGTYYVREVAVKKPYNLRRAIWKFVIEPDGDEGHVTQKVYVNEDGTGNSFVAYTTGTSVTGTDQNVCNAAVENAPQYGRIKIVKTDSEDGSRQQGAEYQVYAKTKVDYTGAGGDYKGSGQTGNQRTPTAGYDTVAGDSGAKKPVGYTKLSPHSDGIGAGIGTYTVNTHPDIAGSDTSKIRATVNTDVAMTVHNLPAGDSSFNETTGKVTVTKPIIFTRADGTQYDTIVTDANGEATTGWLPIDASGSSTYYLVEVRTSNGHVINGNKIEATLTYDSKLQDRECIVSGSNTTNNDESLTQQDAPNGIKVRKQIAPTPANPDGGVLGGVTVGFWKTEDDIEHNKNTNGTKPQASDGTYAFDSIVIRTPDYNSIVPVVHQRVIGTEAYVKAIPSGYAIRLFDREKRASQADDSEEEGDEEGDGEAENEPETEETDASVVFNGSQAGYTSTIPATTYGIEIINLETGEVVEHGGLTEITLHEGDRTGLDVTAGQLSGIITVASESSPIEIRASNLTYVSSLDAFVATNLKAGASYEVEFERQVVKVIQTSATGGKLWFGRYATEDSAWFNKGWGDQAALPTNDARIITSTLMKVEDNNVFTTNTTPLTSGNQSLHTTGNHSWLQDTNTQHSYPYETITDASGAISNSRIGAGEYVMAEIKVPVNTQKHTTYLVDTYAHHFKVDDITGYITDTDTGQADHHGSLSHQVEKTKSFIFDDDSTKLKISKYKIAGSQELEGAELVLTADNNDEIDRWISTDQPHYIENLIPGYYWLTEYVTPKNYDKAESVRFNLLPTGEIQHCIMQDRPISIDAEIDKKQEIAMPLGDGDYPNGDGRNRADAQDNDQGFYAYSLDFRSTSNTWTDEFTVEDPLEPANRNLAHLVSLITPQAFQDYDGKVNVWYKTNMMANDYQDLAEDNGTNDADDVSASDQGQSDDNADQSGDATGDASDGQDDGNKEQQPTRKPTGSTKYVANATLEDGHENPWLYDSGAMVADPDSDGRIIDYTGWKLWKKDLPAAVATKLDVAELNLPEGEYITGFRFEYGRVEVGFTSRIDGWDDELLHYDHDDVAKISGLSNQSFQAAGTATDAAIARMNIVTGRFTTDMSLMLESQVKQQRKQALEDYKQNLIDIEEYNRQVAQLDDGTLPKFAEALVVPAYTDDAEEIERLDLALEASKASLQAAFPLATDPDARDLLLLTSRQAVADLETIISQDALDNLNAKIQAYQDEIDRIPSDAGGYDIDHANEELMNAFMWALDDIRQFGLSGRTMYAPAVVHMQLTEAYVPGIVMRNSAKVDAYRNGGNDDGRPKIGTCLTNKKDGTHAVGASGLVTVVDKVSYQGLTPGEEYTMSGSLHVRIDDTDAGILVDDGKEVTASTTFVPTSQSGTVSLEFTFHAEILEGNSAVAFEECKMTSDAEFQLDHRNIKDGWQTVNEKGDVDLTDDNGEGDLEGHDRDEVIQTPRHKDDIFIGTKLATFDSKKIVEADGTRAVVLNDIVDYHNLVPGHKYRMDGILHVRAYDAKSKTPVDGGTIKGSRGTTIFVPEQPDGTVEVKLIMPASEVLFQPVVAYETLSEYKSRGGEEHTFVVATHEDITNEDQTVRVTMLAKDLIQTGNPLPMAAVGSVMVTSCLAFVAHEMNKRKRA